MTELTNMDLIKKAKRIKANPSVNSIRVFKSEDVKTFFKSHTNFTLQPDSVNKITLLLTYWKTDELLFTFRLVSRIVYVNTR